MAKELNYDVTVLAKEGTCKEDLFLLMAENGDLTSQKLTDVLNEVVTIIGYAKCKITVDSGEFELYYYDTKEKGLISSGSEIFAQSVATYFGKVDKVRITEIKTKKGKTYKAVPVLHSDDKKEDDATNLDALPF